MKKIPRTRTYYTNKKGERKYKLGKKINKLMDVSSDCTTCPHLCMCLFDVDAEQLRQVNDNEFRVVAEDDIDECEDDQEPTYCGSGANPEDIIEHSRTIYRENVSDDPS